MPGERGKDGKPGEAVGFFSGIRQKYLPSTLTHNPTLATNPLSPPPQHKKYSMEYNVVSLTQVVKALACHQHVLDSNFRGPFDSAKRSGVKLKKKLIAAEWNGIFPLTAPNLKTNPFYNHKFSL